MKVRALIVVMHVVTIVIAVPVNIGKQVVDEMVSDAVKDCTGKCKIGVHGTYMISHPGGSGKIVEYKGIWKIVGTKDAAARNTSRDLAQTSVGNAIQNDKREAESSISGSYHVDLPDGYHVDLPDGRRQRADFTADHYGGTIGDAQVATLNTLPGNAAQDAAQDAALDIARTVTQNAAKVAARNASRDVVQASAKDAVQNGKQGTERNAEQHITRDKAHYATGEAN